MKLLRYNYRLIYAAVVVLMAAVFASCDKNNDEPEPEDKFARTIFVYMIADNSLGSYFHSDEDNLSQMETVASRREIPEGGRLIVYYDGSGTEPQLLEITEQGRKVLKQYSEDESSVDIERMREVMSDVRALTPQAELGVILWSHGTGWIESSVSRAGSEVTPNSFGQDLSPVTSEMKVTSLAKALEGYDIDFIYFDCCFMATVEVAYELRNVTPWIIASATELPIEGMPYAVNIPAMFAHELDLKKVAQNTLDYYLGKDSYNYCTISLISTQALEKLAEATKLVMQTGALPLDSYRAMPFFRTDGAKSYSYDMAHYVMALPVDSKLLDAWRKAYDDALPYYGATPISYGLDMRDFSGLGCYIVRTPADATRLGYNNMQWWKDVVSVNPSLKVEQ